VTSSENLTTKQPTAAAGHGERLQRLLPFLALAFPALVYYPITRHYFFSDDFLNLFHIANDSLGQYLVTPNGGHVLFARNAIFYAMRQLFGTQPEPYYWSIFLTHLLNVWLLFRVIERTTSSARLAVFGAALWGACPFSEGTLDWYAVYGHVVVATALLIILLQATRAAARQQPPSPAMRWLWYGLALIATTSFGTGVSIAIALPFALAILLGANGPAWRQRVPPLISLLVVVPAVYAGLNWLYQQLSGAQPFGLATLPRLLSNWPVIPVYWAHLIALGVTRLLVGFYPGPWDNPRVWYGLLGCFLAALVVALLRAPQRVRRQLAACLLLLVACYGMVALGRAYYLSGLSREMFIALSRYHYVGQLILAIMLCLILKQFGGRVVEGRSGRGTEGSRDQGIKGPSAGRQAPASGRCAWPGTAALTVWYAVTIMGYFVFAGSIDQPGEARAQTQQVLAAIQSAIEAQPPGEPVRIENRDFDPLPLPRGMFPGWAAAFTIFYPDNTVNGRRVYFVEKSAGVIKAMQHGRRTGTLLVPVQ